MPDGKLTTALDEIRGRGYSKGTAPGLKAGELADHAADDVPRLLAALDEVLKLADGWEPIPSATYSYVAEQLRMAIAHALLGEDGS